jgi:DNA-directed RNA polymerase subunit F
MCRHVDETGSYIHPFILKRLMEDVYNVAERNSDSEPRTVPEAFPPYCKFRASASPCIEIQEVSKIPRAKRYQSKNSKPRCVSSSTKSRRDESFEAQIKQLEHAKKMGILDMSSQDEVEEEILALQMSLISCAEENHRRCGK